MSLIWESFSLSGSWHLYVQSGTPKQNENQKACQIFFESRYFSYQLAKEGILQKLAGSSSSSPASLPYLFFASNFSISAGGEKIGGVILQKLAAAGSSSSSSISGQPCKPALFFLHLDFQYQLAKEAMRRYFAKVSWQLAAAAGSLASLPYWRDECTTGQTAV